MYSKLNMYIGTNIYTNIKHKHNMAYTYINS